MNDARRRAQTERVTPRRTQQRIVDLEGVLRIDSETGRPEEAAFDRVAAARHEWDRPQIRAQVDVARDFDAKVIQ